MNYLQLVQGLLGLNAADAAAANKIAMLLADVTHPTTIQLLQNIRDLEKTVNQINALATVPVPPDPMSQRERFINRAERLSECEGKTIPVFAQGHPNQPYFKQMDLVYCHFGGVGWEYDGPHFALVWEDNHSESEITVIPTTSQYDKEYPDEFKFGRISGLPAKDTVLAVKKMMRISRKRLIQRNGAYKQGQLIPAFKERIEYAIALTFQGETSLEYHVKYATHSDMPVDIQNRYAGIRFMPVRDVQYSAAQHTLTYRKWNEATMRTLQFMAPKQFVKKSYKQNILNNLFSNDATLIAQGIADLQNFY